MLTARLPTARQSLRLLDPYTSHALLIISKSSQFLQVQKSSGAWTEV